jgi:energy-converting hydrogenase Eha subunit G
MEAILLSFTTELATSVITAYGVYAIILAALGRFFGRTPRWQEEIEAIGGVLWLVGVFGWRSSMGLPDTYDLDLLLRYTGVALLVLPRLILAAQKALEHG